MSITLAKSAGFCFGVSRAIDCINKGLSENKKIATLGPIIHNDRVVSSLKEKGVRIIERPQETEEGETLIIRTHGISKNVFDNIKSEFIDATCPFVKKIQSIVQDHYNDGYTIVIAGNKDHPEVIGINGWCNNSAIVVESMEEAPKKLENVRNNKLCVVAQTTASILFWKNLKEFIKNTCQTPLFFDTICFATNERQLEAVEIAKNSDIFFVIGGRESSNNKRLAEIAREVCDNVYHIEGSLDLPRPDAYVGKQIGVTAGASTPDWIIKEVLHTMEENMNTNSINNNEEENWAAGLEETLVTLHTGQKVKGTVVEIHPNEVIVNLNYKSDGVIPMSELTDDPSLKPEDIVKVGEAIDVFVIRVNDVEGQVLLSKKKLDYEKKFENIEKALEDGTVLYGSVIEAVKGGVIVLCEGLKVFVPASQANDRYLSDLSVLVDPNKKVPFKILKFERKFKKIVGTIKQVLIAEKAKKSEVFWADVEAGKEYEGVVKTLTPFGAFVDIGGVDGLIHISELSWSRIKHPSEVLKEGQKVKVFILEANKETGKISLGYKRKEDNPWEVAKSKFEVGSVVSAKVVKIMPFGAFVELLPGVDGLIHISQIANKRIDKPSDELSVGQVVETKILELDWDAKKIGLSIRALLPEEEAPKEAETKEVVAEEKEVAPKEPTEYTEESTATLADNMADIVIEEDK
ncbi:MAG: bifunctional 4-hydroxy-3-methylbut-2-enyl diphosphate reductase/30S ribosomal protein S1 [Bacillota bacterium]|nr:bifunctional 4-hydroxy-3-methylbut-2-enyl diphosphate reductase/30S ribosomal protein S1 [Bacillota bacterium]